MGRSANACVLRKTVAGKAVYACASAYTATCNYTYHAVHPPRHLLQAIKQSLVMSSESEARYLSEIQCVDSRHLDADIAAYAAAHEPMWDPVKIDFQHYLSRQKAERPRLMEDYTDIPFITVYYSGGGRLSFVSRASFDKTDEIVVCTRLASGRIKGAGDLDKLIGEGLVCGNIPLCVDIRIDSDVGKQTHIPVRPSRRLQSTQKPRFQLLTVSARQLHSTKVLVWKAPSVRLDVLENPRSFFHISKCTRRCPPFRAKDRRDQ